VEVSSQLCVPAAFTPRESAVGIHGMGDLIRHKAGLDMRQKETPLPVLEIKPLSSIT
jgi:hypothetical protein